MSDRIRTGEEGFERDKNFAHATAIYLNALYDRGVLTANDLANPTDDMITELAFRTHRGRMTANANYLELDDLNKIERLFNSENVRKEGYPTKDETLSFGREFLKTLKEDFPEVTGMIIFGSLVSSNKYAGPGSDLDVILLVNMKKGDVIDENRILGEGDIEHDPTDVIVSGSSFENLPSLMRKFAREKNLVKFQGIKLSVNHVFNQQVFNEYLDPKNIDENSWWYMFGNAYAIGKLGSLTPKQIDQAILKVQKSEAVTNAKRKILDEIKKNVKFKNRNY